MVALPAAELETISTYLATHYPIKIMAATEPGYQTIVAQISQNVFSGAPFFFYLLVAEKQRRRLWT